MAVFALGGAEPRIHPTAFVHPQATVIGNVEIGAESSVWPSAVLRGDEGYITVGARSSIQDCTVVHTTDEHPNPQPRRRLPRPAPAKVEPERSRPAPVGREE